MKRRSHWKTAAVAGLVCMSVLLVAVATTADEEGLAPAYVGVKKCKTCHKSDKKGDQFGKWESAKHSKAYEALKSDKAKEAAKAKGIDDPLNADACLKCHVTGHGAAADQFEDSFEKEDGVQCEACHGPGSDYKKSSTMKDREKAVAAGMSVPTKETCQKCHNEESPNYKGFCFAHYLAKIYHPNPNVAKEKRVIACECDKGENLVIGADGSLSWEKK